MTLRSREAEKSHRDQIWTMREQPSVISSGLYPYLGSLILATCVAYGSGLRPHTLCELTPVSNLFEVRSATQAYHKDVQLIYLKRPRPSQEGVRPDPHGCRCILLFILFVTQNLGLAVVLCIISSGRDILPLVNPSLRS